MQGILRAHSAALPYGRYGYTRGGGKIWHGGMDLVGLDSTDIRMPYYKNKRITGKVVRARRVTDHSNKTWEWGWYVCVQLDPARPPDDVNYLYFCHCRELKVTAGQAVASGDLLAVMGQSGNAAGGSTIATSRPAPRLPARPGPQRQYAGLPQRGRRVRRGAGAGRIPARREEENADAAKKLQRISIGPVSRGDADAGVCGVRQPRAGGRWFCTKVNGVFEYERKFGQEKRFFICKAAVAALCGAFTAAFG